MLSRTDIYTDGACSYNDNNNGTGGWAFIVTNGGEDKYFSGGERGTTSNRMELIAVIEAIKHYKETYNNIKAYSLRIFSDSTYVVNSINKRWIKKWMMNGWKTSRGTNVVNEDLWRIVNSLEKEVDFQMIYIKGHNGCVLNERCDKLAKEEVKRLLLSEEF